VCGAAAEQDQRQPDPERAKWQEAGQDDDVAVGVTTDPATIRTATPGSAQFAKWPSASPIVLGWALRRYADQRVALAAALEQFEVGHVERERFLAYETGLVSPGDGLSSEA
jgi:hypothetical protein